VAVLYLLPLTKNCARFRNIAFSPIRVYGPLRSFLTVRYVKEDLVMKRLTVSGTLKLSSLKVLWIASLLLILSSGAAFANSIQIFFGPNSSGDNFFSRQWGPGYYAAVGGGTPFDFFNAEFGYAPGSSLGGSTDLFSDGGFAQLHGIGYDLLPLEVGTLFMSGITLPTNGQNFTAQVEIGFSILMEIVDTGEPFNVGGSASGHITFDYFNGSYYPEEFVQAPEPVTLLLLGTGLVAVGWLKHRAKKHAHQPVD